MATANITCSVDGCEKSAAKRGMCSMHYQRDRISKRSTLCALDGCERRARTRGLCSAHYERWRRAKIGEGIHSLDECFAPPLPGNSTPRSDVYYCVACGKEFPGGDGRGRKYCSPKCQTLHFRFGDSIPSLDFTCAKCGAFVRSDRWGNDQVRSSRKFCDECVDRSHDTGYRRKFPVEYLAARDGNSCGICGEEVDLSLRMPNRMCPSIDHIVPVSHGGTDDEDNLQLAHLSCNARRGNRMEQADIVTA